MDMKYNITDETGNMNTKKDLINTEQQPFKDTHKNGEDEQKDSSLKKCLHSSENKYISEIPLNKTENDKFVNNSIDEEKTSKESPLMTTNLNTKDTLTNINTVEDLVHSPEIINYFDTFNKETKPTVNEEKMSLITNSLNKQDDCNKMEIIDDNETLRDSDKVINEKYSGNEIVFDNETFDYSREFINEEFSGDMINIYCDESLEDLQNNIESTTNENRPENYIKSTANENSLKNFMESTANENRPENYIESTVTKNVLDKDEKQDWSIMDNETQLKEKVKPMKLVFGLLCMSFNKGPYEFTLATMSHYISGECDENNYWLHNLDFYIQSLNITHLYVTGYNQLELISKYVYSVKIEVLKKQYLPNLKYRCRKCFRYGCSTYKATSILHYNFKYNFEIPCIFQNENLN